MNDVDYGGLKCICGEWVACYHQECIGLMWPDQKAKLGIDIDWSGENDIQPWKASGAYEGQ